MTNNTTHLKNIGHNIQMVRIAKNLTQEDLAEKCGISDKHISAIERGLSAGSISLIIDICNVLDVTPNYIFSGSFTALDTSINDIPSSYLKLNDENKSFVNQTIEHLYHMQNTNK